MEEVYEFVDAGKPLLEKGSLLERQTLQILQQTVECSVFIRKCAGHGFASELCYSTQIMVLTSPLGRVVNQSLSDPSPTIDALQAKLLALKGNLGSSHILENAFLSTKILGRADEILESVNRLGS